ncbi:MAG: hypothetical protein Ct9H90mP27_0180 [Gammaproteobacteria bacterium]|nr:MAG: hypothetical protein Ct9H90mP27_0180 [Gammaproteobacteria bacterium]
MWGPDGELHDMNAVIPDRSYAGVYQETIKHCDNMARLIHRLWGRFQSGFDGSKSEEYGSHDTTLSVPRR